MAKQKRSLWSFLIFFGLCLPFLISAFSAQSQSTKIDKDKIKKVNPRDFPVTNFETLTPSDPKERAKREAKGKKYNRPEATVHPNLVTVFDIYHWDSTTPSMPVKQSDAVILGEVTRAEAHLSSDKTGIYSEFTIQPLRIFKNDLQKPFSTSEAVVAERTGGRVLFPSGQISLMYVSGLGVPQVGKKYVFFLTHNFDYRVRRDEDYRILTGYQLQDGSVVPLDSSGVVNFDAHLGKNEQEFLNELEAVIQGFGK